MKTNKLPSLLLALVLLFLFLFLFFSFQTKPSNLFSYPTRWAAADVAERMSKGLSPALSVVANVDYGVTLGATARVAAVQIMGH